MGHNFHQREQDGKIGEILSLGENFQLYGIVLKILNDSSTTCISHGLHADIIIHWRGHFIYINAVDSEIHNIEMSIGSEAGPKVCNTTD